MKHAVGDDARTRGARLWLCRSLESQLRSQARRRWVLRVLWNGIAYVFFGFGTKTGALGIRDTAIFGPEIGILGLISNAVFAFLFWQWWRTRCNRT